MLRKIYEGGAPVRVSKVTVLCRAALRITHLLVFICRLDCRLGLGAALGCCCPCMQRTHDDTHIMLQS